MNNIRNAKRERKDDFSALEQLSTIREISALWHYALNALGMIWKIHYGNNIDDPGSLASHKARLGRVFDANQAEYAPTKSLVRHSLIARLLDITMYVPSFTWAPIDC